MALETELVLLRSEAKVRRKDKFSGRHALAEGLIEERSQKLHIKKFKRRQQHN